MGYYVNITGGEVRIPKENLAEAYRLMCELNQRDDLKNGGSWGGENDSRSPRPAGLDYHPGKWFSWMDANYPATCADAKAVLTAIGFDLMEDGDGTLVVWGYDNKTGQEELFLNSIAHLCDEGSFHEWRGEDGAMWRHEYGPKGAVTKTATIVWQ